MAKRTPFHVYATDGFESAHSSLDAAVRAARRGAIRLKKKYEVVETSAHGFTGGGHGTVVWESEKFIKNGKPIRKKP